jgi:hypothetical protein
MHTVEGMPKERNDHMGDYNIDWRVILMSILYKLCVKV